MEAEAAKTIIQHACDSIRQTSRCQLFDLQLEVSEGYKLQITLFILEVNNTKMSVMQDLIHLEIQVRNMAILVPDFEALLKQYIPIYRVHGPHIAHEKGLVLCMRRNGRISWYGHLPLGMTKEAYEEKIESLIVVDH